MAFQQVQSFEEDSSGNDDLGLIGYQPPAPVIFRLPRMGDVDTQFDAFGVIYRKSQTFCPVGGKRKYSSG